MERTEHARAKVNLFLHVLGRRPDGYHLLDSLAVFPAVADTLCVGEADDLALEITGPFGAALGGYDNLVLRAARALRDAAGARVGAALTLDKQLPVASGIGGGSADAAAALRLLDRFWGLGLPAPRLAGIALELGADVPVCLLSTPARMGGIGELIGTAPVLPPCGMVLVNPGVPVATADIFRAREAVYSAPAVLPARWAHGAEMAADLARLTNDLEAPAIRLCPLIGDALTWLRAQPGCRLGRMSGSGATCFGLFETAAEAEAVSPPPPGWWSWSGALG
ncbi:MAG: 4-(cytidine 5'-diphospho)-2-C-methyl-D-erythritol kinase [Acetobacteraceae bacterium]|nr:4-(cytidine 5'-diphospho)-2-C-methyl-D-erythritol kinase [Acetobacteraceae bacterium]